VSEKRNFYVGDWRYFYWNGNCIENHLNNLFKSTIDSEAKLLWEDPDAEEKIKAFNEKFANKMRQKYSD